MPGTTPLYGLTYPIGSDRLDDAVSTIPQQLAEDIEATIAGFGGIAAPGSWSTYSYGSGWADWGSTAVELPRYRKVGNRVTVQGLVQRTSGSGTTMFTLPSGYRPPRDLNRGGQTVNGVGSGVVTVAATGDVVLNSSYTNGQYVNLFIEFDVDSA